MIKNINTMYFEALDICNELNIKTGKITNVTWNNRLRAVWGRCIYHRRTNTYSIELNPILAGDDVSWEDAMDTMIHEVLHAHKNRMCHTGEWKYYAQLISKEYPLYNITRCTSAEEKNVADKIARSYKYTITCMDCGRETKYQREGRIVKLVRRYPGSCRCVCGSTNLKLFEN